MLFAATTWLWIACGLSGATFLLHVLPGTKDNVPPLLKSDMAAQPKFTNYYCWHLVTVSIFALAAMFAWAALDPLAWRLALVATLVSAAFALLSLAVVAKSGLSIWLLPQWLFFGPICIAGAMAFL